MKINTKISPLNFFHALSFSFCHLAAAPNSKQGAGEKEHLFPGTGFFVKNRDPYDEKIAKKMVFGGTKKVRKRVIPRSFVHLREIYQRRSDASK